MTYSNHLKFTVLIVVFLLGNISVARSFAWSGLSHMDHQVGQFLVDCDEIEVKLDIIHTTANRRNGKIVMNFKKSNISYTSFVFSGKDQNNRLDVKDNEISDLEKGEYNLYIQDKNGCTKHIKFKIN